MDEAHCCSSWGHDFRPDYTKFFLFFCFSYDTNSRLSIFKHLFPKVPLIALTATATVKVQEDVCIILSIPDCNLFRTSFNRSRVVISLFYCSRPNLCYFVEEKVSTGVDQIANFIKTRYPHDSGIVYGFSRKECEKISKELQGNGIKVREIDYYVVT